MRQRSYQVAAFSADNLIAFFVKGSHKATVESLRQKPQIEYLVEYCRIIGTKTIVFEPEYVDRHFLEDYAG